MKRDRKNETKNARSPWLSRVLVFCGVAILAVGPQAHAEPLMKKLGFASYRFEQASLHLAPTAEADAGDVQSHAEGRLRLYYEDDRKDRKIVVEVPVDVAFRKEGIVARSRAENGEQDTLRIRNAHGVQLSDLLGSFSGFEVVASPLWVRLGDIVMFKKTSKGRWMTASEEKQNPFKVPRAAVSAGASFAKVTMTISPKKTEPWLELVMSRTLKVSRIYELDADLLSGDL
ncbi:MAG: hypothetical protein NDI61_05960 [Bdellovibrionaceae bacterium]|nr:hypothetical protein [Pseudobdellovibrionaceae bacterium]